MEQNYTLNIHDFLKDPYTTSLDGYNPCLSTSISWVANWFGKDVFSAMAKDTKELFDCSVVDFPLELIKNLLQWLLVLSIPLGGCVVLGVWAYCSVYNEKTLNKRREEHKKWKESFRR